VKTAVLRKGRAGLALILAAAHFHVKCPAMRRKRFKHQAYTFCHMFCGWQLYADYERLIELGNGKLTINILTKECHVDSESINQLSMASVLNSWLTDDLETSKIPSKWIDEAILTVEFRINKVPKSRRGVSIIEHDFKCKGKIRSGVDTYAVDFSDQSGSQSIIRKTT
jgi:hypothetical protein